MRIKVSIAVGISIIILYLAFGYVFPVTLVGKPLPLFEICNKDLKPHNVRIMILNGDEEVLNVSYRMMPKSRVSYERSFGWYPKPTFTLITWADGKYRFIVSTENHTISHEFRVHPWMTIHFFIENGSIRWRVVVV